MIEGVNAIETTGIASGDSKLAELREATGKVVGQIFYATLLHASRESNLKGEYGHGGRGEDVFGAQLDSMLAERAGTANWSNLHEAVFQKLRPQQVRMDEINANLLAAKNLIENK